ncbi:MAG: hypothetical protein WC454_05095 [Phycisphaerae bacterium]|jgi:hypothetical protein
MRKLVLIAICVCSLVPAFAEDKPTDKVEGIIDKLVKSINEQNYDLIGGDFDPPMQGEDNRRRFFDNLLTDYGKIISTDKLWKKGGLITFVGHCERGDIDMTLWLNNENKITGLSFLPHKPDTSVPEQNEVLPPATQPLPSSQTPPSTQPPSSHFEVKWLILILCVFIGGIAILKLSKRGKNVEQKTDK